MAIYFDLRFKMWFLLLKVRLNIDLREIFVNWTAKKGNPKGINFKITVYRFR